MYYYIYNQLSKYLPDELIFLILFKYSGLKHPISHSCFYVKQNAKQIKKEHIYYIWNERKNNNFSNNVFICFYKVGNIDFVKNQTNKICFNNFDGLGNFSEKYGLIHYFNNTWVFPNYCNKATLIYEVSKNIEPSKIQEYQLEKLTRKELINLYFKL